MSQILSSVVFPGWFFEGALHRPSSRKPVFQQRPRYSKFIHPLSDCFGNAMKGKNSVTTPVVHLLFCCGPFAVFWRVAKVVVNSIYRHVSRAFAHIGQKVFKFKPSFTNCNSSAEIPHTTINTSVLAPVYHRPPSSIGVAFGHAMRGIGDLSRKSEDFFVKASAGLTSARSQIIACRDMFISTFTKAYPCDIPAPYTVLMKHGKSAKSLFGKINLSSHKAL